GDGVAGAAVDLDQLAVLADAQLGEVGVLAQVADEDVLQVAAELIDDVGDEIVGQRPGGLHALDAAVDAGGLEDADDDGEAAFAVHLPEHDDLLLVDLVDDDAFELHVDRHDVLTFGRGPSLLGPTLSTRFWNPRLSPTGGRQRGA